MTQRQSKNLLISYVAVSLLKPDPKNPRKHSAKQIKQIATSIQKFGFNAPLLVNAEQQVIAGHGRLEAAKECGLAEVPVIHLDHLSPDQARAYNRWLDNTLLSRLNDKENGAIIIIMQRLHADDLTGHVLEQGGWEILSLPAIAEEDESYEYKIIGARKLFTRKKGDALHPEREPLETLLKLKATLGEYNFASQYQQRPAPEGGGLVKEKWFPRYDHVPSHFDLTIHSWDTASKPTELADYSVGTVWGVLDDKMYLLDVFRKKVDYPQLKYAVKSYSGSYNPDVILIEDKASGIQLIQELKFDGMWNVKGITPTDNKIMRLHAQTARIEAGLVLLPKEAPWLEEYLKEVTTFPYGKHDDQVDSTAQALQYMVMGQPLNAPMTSHLFRL